MTKGNANLKKIKRVVILAGGWSGEREVSLSSGKEMYNALVESGQYAGITIVDVGLDVSKLIRDIQDAKPDVILNALHGVGGEDGVIQGVLEMLQIPYTHSGVTASAVAMDKVLSRIILAHVGIPVPAWELCHLEDLKKGPSNIKMPLVIKPRNEGSSLGVYIIKSDEDLVRALDDWQYGECVLVEEYIQGQEVQTAVLNGKAIGTIEVRPHGEFFDYRCKYTDGGATHVMPAQIPEDAYQRIQELAEAAYDAIGCKGVARIDFMYRRTGDGADEQRTGDGAGAQRGEGRAEGSPYLLEVNSQPGMTPCSLVPEIARHAGLSYLDVIELMLKGAVGVDSTRGFEKMTKRS
ncbi:MAG: D-alanine--D-alanine ligase [Holosporales bacterium]|jgi:D-alanine-D-alanine ligase|nr:D-alanine--D-alanine ligase [Holosporales bacterium]